MYLLINVKVDGQNTKYYDKPFKGSHIISYRDDNKVYTYAYDDCVELARSLHREQDGTLDTIIFKVYPNMEQTKKIDDIQLIHENDAFLQNLKMYEDYYIHGFNDLPDWITVKDYIKELEAI